MLHSQRLHTRPCPENPGCFQVQSFYRNIDMHIDVYTSPPPVTSILDASLRVRLPLSKGARCHGKFSSTAVQQTQVCTQVPADPGSATLSRSLAKFQTRPEALPRASVCSLSTLPASCEECLWGVAVPSEITKNEDTGGRATPAQLSWLAAWSRTTQLSPAWMCCPRWHTPCVHYCMPRNSVVGCYTASWSHSWLIQDINGP